MSNRTHCIATHRELAAVILKSNLQRSHKKSYKMFAVRKAKNVKDNRLIL